MNTMKFVSLVKRLEDRYVNDKFIIKANAIVVKAINIPATATGGVYIISAQKTREVVYIGKAGSITQSGHIKKQGLKKRLMAQQVWEGKKYRRSRLFKLWIKRLKQPIEIKWFITLDYDNKIAPAKIEADLLQAYFADNGNLPRWNKIL